MSKNIYEKRVKCSSCGNKNFHEILDLGLVPLAGYFPSKEELENESAYPLKLVFCNKCQLVQTDSVIDPDILFKDYRYMSSVGLSNHFKVVADKLNLKYDIFGTKTCRLTTKKHSFPILTFPKKYRSIVKPNNDLFVELDYNAAELRMLLALSGKEQPSEDIHDWNVSNVYQNSLTREAAKKRIFAWLYNPKSKDKLSNKAYDRNSILKKYYNGY